MMARPQGRRPKHVIISAVHRYVAGDPLNDIAVDSGVTQPTVSYWMKKYGVQYGKNAFKRRRQGRRKEIEPNDRDKEIMYLHSLGMPAAHIADQYGMKRSRSSFIIKTWKERGYVTPPPPYKNGDIVQFHDEGGGAIYRLEEVQSTSTAVATLIQEFIPSKDGSEGSWRYVECNVVIDQFRFYKNRQIAKIIQEAPAVIT